MDTTRSTDSPRADPANGAELFWDEHYRTHQRTQGERANPLLVETAEALRPGAALDLGCGAGGDTIWLARNGWQVTAVDISATAVERVRERARECGVADQVVTEAHDLTCTFPGGEFDLVSAQYFHTASRRRAASCCAPPLGLCVPAVSS